MASLPPQRSQRRASPQRQQSPTPEASTQPRQNSQSPSAKSIDSETLLLNDPSSSNTRNSAVEGQAKTTSNQDSGNNAEPRKCWICFQDETEDGPEASPWRTPCPCALTAHEACLLDWIADMEAPDNSQSTAAPKEIICPQCKSEIRLARPRSLIVEATSHAEQLTGKLLVPGVTMGLAYGLGIVMAHHGMFTIQMIFGSETAEAITAPSPYLSVFEATMLRYLPTISRPFIRHWRGHRVEFGLPIIPAALIASRTTLGDAVLPILPILFFATHPRTSAELTNGLWPPSAALTLIVLPYVRGLYNEYLERVWGEQERRWMKQIRPRLGEEGNVNDAHAADGHHHDHDHDVVQVEVDIEIESSDDGSEGGDGEQDDVLGLEQIDALAPRDRPADAQGEDERPAAREEQPQNAERQQELRQEAEARVNDLAQQVQEAAEQQEQRQHNHHQHHHQHRGQIDLVASATRIAETSLGALAFPAISAAMGQILHLVLPASWVVPQVYRRQIVPTGLLQTRWGRSIIGGCLFVVLKDAVRIYCRWKMAQTFQRRRVQDYNKALGKFVAPG